MLARLVKVHISFQIHVVYQFDSDKTTDTGASVSRADAYIGKPLSMLIKKAQLESIFELQVSQ